MHLRTSAAYMIEKDATNLNRNQKDHMIKYFLPLSSYIGDLLENGLLSEKEVDFFLVKKANFIAELRSI